MIAHSVRNPRAPIYTPNPINRRSSLNRGLVLWYFTLAQRMGGLTWVDLTGFYPGILTNPGSGNGWRSSTHPGGFGSILFDGAGGNLASYVGSSTCPNITGSFAITLWMRRTGSPAGTDSAVVDIGSFSANTGFGIWINLSASQLGWRVGPNFNNYQSLIPTLNTWEHYALVFNGATKRFFKNGTAATSSTNSTAPAAASSFRIGRRADSGDGFQGNLDDVRIFSRAPSDAEIFDIFNESRYSYLRTLNHVSHGFSRTSGGLLLRRRKAVCGL